MSYSSESTDCCSWNNRKSWRLYFFLQPSFIYSSMYVCLNFLLKTFQHWLVLFMWVHISHCILYRPFLFTFYIVALDMFDNLNWYIREYIWKGYLWNCVVTGNNRPMICKFIKWPCYFIMAINFYCFLICLHWTD